MSPVYDVGDIVRCQATFAASGGAVSDPSQIHYLVLPPGSTVATHRYGLTPSQIVRVSTGAYYLDLDITAEGGWQYRWEGTGNNVQVAEETGFEIRNTFKL